jgi:DNA mismatch endonuclease (patch repair protein)
MDKLSPARRSANMRAIRAKNTKPELVVRQMLRKSGLTGYRLHRKDLPGRPDIAFIGRKRAIFVHGCFWHGHNCREGSRKPKSRTEYWSPKIVGNRARDERQRQALHEAGWKTMVVWNCELKDPKLPSQLHGFVLDAAP